MSGLCNILWIGIHNGNHTDSSGREAFESDGHGRRRQKVNRSALIRQALREHLERVRVGELEERDRRAYEALPQRAEEFRPWEEIASWPED